MPSLIYTEWPQATFEIWGISPRWSLSSTRYLQTSPTLSVFEKDTAHHWSLSYPPLCMSLNNISSDRVSVAENSKTLHLLSFQKLPSCLFLKSVTAPVQQFNLIPITFFALVHMWLFLTWEDPRTAVLLRIISNVKPVRLMHPWRANIRHMQELQTYWGLKPSWLNYTRNHQAIWIHHHEIQHAVRSPLWDSWSPNPFLPILASMDFMNLNLHFRFGFPFILNVTLRCRPRAISTKFPVQTVTALDWNLSS